MASEAFLERIPGEDTSVRRGSAESRFRPHLWDQEISLRLAHRMSEKNTGTATVDGKASGARMSEYPSRGDGLQDEPKRSERLDP
jgi:hypothetical protein